MVDRYVKYSGGLLKLPSTTKDGSCSFVRYEDYEALEAKLARLVEALEAIRDGEVRRNRIYPSDIARADLAAKEGSDEL